MTYRSFNIIDYVSFSLDLIHSMQDNDIAVQTRTIYKKALKYDKINCIKNIIETNFKDYTKSITLQINY